MKIGRIRAWDQIGPDTFLSQEAKLFMENGRVPAIAETFGFVRGPGPKWELTMLRTKEEAFALIPKDAPHWAEWIVEQFFDDKGRRRDPE